ncbi:hypothetical protein ARALYDRAFT_892778 [Arabidopsis lyrata subsp. lyrata]|uniref:Cyclic nucleotide-binding domain-containing protein n=2 Tax=Arabidopsis lyrata subsp. lyrata TaxID=81972 RepID=D7KQ48_ARALL|nr:hypothetical protein ARALYDRAFT_892778 [Arabidopsis lyrata subsp. lyrata]
MLLCFAAFAIDPLFLFIPVIDSHRFCFTYDKKLGLAACLIRIFIDSFYVIHIIFRSITELIAPRSQVVVLTFFIRKQQSALLVSKDILKKVIICQYIPRILRIYPLFQEVTKASGTVVETKWIGAALNLFLYMLPSYVFGGFWYLNAIQRENLCWHDVCVRTRGCNVMNLYCARGSEDNNCFLNNSCPLIDPGQITNSTVFNFGMYIDALKSGVVESRYFPRKFFYCFWWGLRNLRFVNLNFIALGQNLETSNSVEEIVFAINICILGLLLFALLIGNVQKYLQSTTIKIDEMEERKRDIEKWMSYRNLPDDLKQRIRKYGEYTWKQTRGIEEEALLRSLPIDLRLETKRHLYLNLLKGVPLFEGIDDGWLLAAVCNRVKYVFYSADSYIVKEGDPLEEMLIITKGKLKSTTRSHEIGEELKAGDICGQLLFNSSCLPTSTRTIITLTEVEGFTLSPDDVKFVASHFNHLQSVIHKQMSRQGLETEVGFKVFFLPP